MKLFIYLQVKPINQIAFSSALALGLKKEIPELVLFEADQQSDNFQVKIGKDLIKEADSIFTLIETLQEENISQLSQLFEELRKFNRNLLILHKGENKAIETMIKITGAQTLAEESIKEIKAFYHS